MFFKFACKYKSISEIVAPILIILLYIYLTFIGSLDCSAQGKLAGNIEFKTTITGDFIFNFRGGIEQGFTFIGKEDLTLGLDTEKAGLWKNGYFFIHGLNTHGIDPSERFTGDLQVFSNLDAGDHTGLFEFWYSHEIGKFSVLIGQHDLNSEFLGSKYSSILVNSSFGIMPSVSLNMPISIYPLAAPGLVLKYKSSKNVIFRYGFYDGSPGDFLDNRYNLNIRLSSLEGFFNIAEIQYNQMDGENEIGNFKIGGCYHSGIFPDYRDSTKSIKGNYSFYALADKSLFPRSLNSWRGLCIFLQAGVTNPVCSRVQYYLGGGFRYHGILPERFKDQLGVGFAQATLSKDYDKRADSEISSETAIETTYIFRISNNYSIQPSFQYIINPGADKNLDNCIIGLLRFTLSF